MHSNTSEAATGRQHLHKKRRLANINCSMKKLRMAMEEANDEQNNMKEAEGNLTENLEAMEVECHKLRQETILVTQQTVNTQIRLSLMFQILKARGNRDFPQASRLTSALRELMEKEK
ncbi:Retrotransposon, unclassified-like protein [Hibiscus syriacus]|uniref:Retrotransposon, unclassified-like protein n=1 Tax=Hibiscus syriacus TaxID=106335 RepID=A0A6A2XP15_HIBSY|nr:Retrotransposon, unclassified-like protein [Hibiscus syriacus]